jgi:hypothetical protein
MRKLHLDDLRTLMDRTCRDLGTTVHEPHEKALKYIMEDFVNPLQKENDELKKLLNATRTILQKCEDSPLVLEVMHQTAFYDGAECDGYCLLEDIKDLLPKEPNNQD